MNSNLFNKSNKKKKLKIALNILNKKLTKKTYKKKDLDEKRFLKFKSIKISLASPNTIKKWANNFNKNIKKFKNNKIFNAKTFNYKTLTPEKGGLFCEQIFGALKTQQRRYKLGYIELICPVVHVWYLKGSISYISLLLNLKKKKLESITYCSKLISGQVKSFDNDLTFDNFNSLIHQKFLYFNYKSNIIWKNYLFNFSKNSDCLVNTKLKNTKLKNFSFLEFSFFWIKFILIYPIFFSSNLNKTPIGLKKNQLKLTNLQLTLTNNLKNATQLYEKKKITFYTLDFPILLFSKNKKLKTYFLNFYDTKKIIVNENPLKHFFIAFPLFFDKKILKYIFFYNQNFLFYKYNLFTQIDFNLSSSMLMVNNNAFNESINNLGYNIYFKKKLSKNLKHFYNFQKKKQLKFNEKGLKKKFQTKIFFSNLFLIKTRKLNNFILKTKLKFIIFFFKQIKLRKKQKLAFNLSKIKNWNINYLFKKSNYYLSFLIKQRLLISINLYLKLKKNNRKDYKKYFYQLFNIKKISFFQTIIIFFIKKNQIIKIKFSQNKKINSLILTKIFYYQPLFSAACFSILSFQKNIKFLNLFKLEFNSNLNKFKSILEFNSDELIYNYIFFIKKTIIETIKDQKPILMQLKFQINNNKKLIKKLNKIIKYNYKIFYFPISLETKFYNINKFLLNFSIGLEPFSNKIVWFNFSTKYLKNYNYKKTISLEKDFFLKKNFNLYDTKHKKLKNPLGNIKFRNFLLEKMISTIKKSLIISKIKKSKFLFKNFSITNNILTKTTNFSTKITLNDNLNLLTSFFSPNIHINKKQGLKHEQKKIIYFILKTFNYKKNLIKKNEFWSLKYNEFFLPAIIYYKESKLKNFGSYKGISIIPLQDFQLSGHAVLLKKNKNFIIIEYHLLNFIKTFISKFYLEVIALSSILPFNLYEFYLNPISNTNIFFNYYTNSSYFLNKKILYLKKKKIIDNLMKNIEDFLLNYQSNFFNKYYIINQNFTWLTIDEWQHFLSYMTQLSIKNDKIIPGYFERGINFSLPLTGGIVIQNLLKNFKFSHHSNNQEMSLLFSKLKKKQNSTIELLILHIQRKIFFLNQKLQYFEEFLKFRLILLKKNKKTFFYFSDDLITETYQKIELLRFLRIRYFRRIKLLRPFVKKNIKPEWMVLNILPVLPPDLRPVVILNDNQMAVSDLNKLYQKVIIRNRRLKRLFTTTLFSTLSPELRYAQRLLQESVDALIENGKADTNSIVTAHNRPLKSLSDLLKGKKGRFRLNLLGKRVDYSGRSVIVSGPSLQFYECGLPKQMALELFQPFLIRYLLLKKVVNNFTKAKKLIQQKSNIIWKILEKVIHNRPILLNRAPTLHRLGIQCFKPRLVQGRAILLHPLVCSAFNADFDGDQMAVHIPLSYQACAEAWKLMWSRNNIRSPATGESIVVPSQDMVLGCYYLTTIDNIKRLNHFSFNYLNLISCKKCQLFTNFEFNKLIFFFSFLKKYEALKSIDINQIKKNNNSFFTNIDQILQLFNQNKLNCHNIIWLKWHLRFELVSRQQFCFEIQINQNGNVVNIYSEYKIYFNYEFNTKNIYIKTTPGRILMNQLLFYLNF